MSAPDLPGAPPLPVAKRLNRNALTVAAVLMGITVLVAVVTLNAKRPAGEAKATVGASVPTLAQPSFLDVPTRREMATPPPPIAADAPISATPPIPPLGGAGMPSYADPYAVPGPKPSVDPVAEAYHRALASPVLATASPPVAGANNALPMQKMAAAGVGAAPVADTLGVVSGTIAMSGVIPSSPYRIDAGTVIPAALIRAINSDLPGQLVAQVTRSVYDSRTLRTLLVPQGTKLIGRYRADITTGQNRLQIIWTRLIFPDGQSLAMLDADAVDDRGATGVPGHVNNHERRIFGTALLTSIISAAVQLSQPQQSGGPFTAPSAQQVAAGALGQQLSTVGLETLRRNLDLRPTITLPEGTAINVLLSNDLDLPGPYTMAPSAGR